jgi:uncharacterized protein (DUF2461 family)
MASSVFQEEWEMCAEALEYLRNQWEDHNERKIFLSRKEIYEVNMKMVELKYCLDSAKTFDDISEFRRKHVELNHVIVSAAVKMGFTIQSRNVHGT